MAYFLIKGMPACWIYHPNQTIVLVEDWLVSVQPGTRNVNIVATRGQDDKVWGKNHAQIASVPHHVKDAHKMLIDSDEAQEVSEEEACLILFEIK